MSKRIRKKKSKKGPREEKSPGRDAVEKGTDDEIPKPPSHFTSERMNRTMRKMVDKHEFGSTEEINDFLQENFMGRTYDELKAEMEYDPVEEAQELAFQAMEADDPEELIKLTMKALELDPECVDALMILAYLASGSKKEEIKMVKEVIRRAEKRMGKSFFEEHKGHFWSMIETRPYMRARQTMVDLLIDVGRIPEAVRHCEEMLELNPNDNQGIRDTLIGLYLEKEDLSGARSIFESYPESILATFSYSRVLERFLSGDMEGAQKAFEQAYENNPHVYDYLAGNREPPQKRPDYFRPGHDSEAIVCMKFIGKAWQKHPRAVQWLKSIRGEKPRGVK